VLRLSDQHAQTLADEWAAVLLRAMHVRRYDERHERQKLHSADYCDNEDDDNYCHDRDNDDVSADTDADVRRHLSSSGCDAGVREQDVVFTARHVHGQQLFHQRRLADMRHVYQRQHWMHVHAVGSRRLLLSRRQRGRRGALPAADDDHDDHGDDDYDARKSDLLFQSHHFRPSQRRRLCVRDADGAVRRHAGARFELLHSYVPDAAGRLLRARWRQLLCRNAGRVRSTTVVGSDVLQRRLGQFSVVRQYAARRHDVPGADRLSYDDYDGSADDDNDDDDDSYDGDVCSNRLLQMRRAHVAARTMLGECSVEPVHAAGLFSKLRRHSMGARRRLLCRPRLSGVPGLPHAAANNDHDNDHGDDDYDARKSDLLLQSHAHGSHRRRRL
jgi:hypothetical protein